MSAMAGRKEIFRMTNGLFSACQPGLWTLENTGRYQLSPGHHSSPWYNIFASIHNMKDPSHCESVMKPRIVDSGEWLVVILHQRHDMVDSVVARWWWSECGQHWSHPPWSLTTDTETCDATGYTLETLFVPVSALQHIKHCLERWVWRRAGLIGSSTAWIMVHTAPDHSMAQLELDTRLWNHLSQNISPCYCCLIDTYQRHMNKVEQ